MTSLLDAFSLVHDEELYSVCDRVEIAARAERRRPVPQKFLEGRVGEWLRTDLAPDGALWNHQSLALESIAQGRSVILATDTASGKSLVFHLAAFSQLTQNLNSRFIVFYPQIALANDQLVHWRKAATSAGFSASIIGEIHGGVSQADRSAILREARIVLMTPDVCQAWFLRNVASQEVRDFLIRLAGVFLDEAHVFEGVMGSNAALLTRRLAVARSCARGGRTVEPLRIVAASATIANPAAHMEALFGVDADVVDLTEDGSPSFTKTLLHVAADDERKAAHELLSVLLEGSDAGTFIAFADSRQGVERIARDLEHDGVQPYRSGYEDEDRRTIEEALRCGELRGVVSTSALELGINIPHFTFGINIGVPNSRKALRQRVGRVGRFAPGAFAILADRFAFTRLGSTLADYWRGSIEPSCLYLENRFVQFAHSRCLAEELEAIGRKAEALPDADWPQGFASIYALALPAAARPAEFDAVAAIGADDPHRNYPLRNIGEVRYAFVEGPERLGNIALQQAIREAYPGAVYLYRTKPYRVYEWRTTPFENVIRVGKSSFPGPTKPISRTWVNAAIDPQGIIDGHYMTSDVGCLAECQLQITERVEGYVERGQRKIYRELRDPCMRNKIREFRTTGVLFQASGDWFRLSENKRRFADALRDLVLREHSIAPQDVDVAFTNISLLQAGRRVAISDAVVLFDSTYGSLRLSEPAFTQATSLIDRLRRACELVKSDDAPVSPVFLDQLTAWYEDLKPCEAATLTMPQDGLLRVFRPGSIVARHGFNSHTPVETEIIKPVLMMQGDGSSELSYHTRDVFGKRELFLAQSAVIAVGDDWSEVLWNPTTDEYVEEDAEGGPDAA